jgi:phospholipid transport system transporter-binding protein
MLMLPTQITHDQARTCASMLAQALRRHAESAAVVDASALQQFDSSALAVLLECRREALALGKSFSVRGLPTRLRSLAGLYGVGELLPAAP